VIVRDSTAADVETITAIYGDHVLQGTGSFELVPPNASEIASRREDVLKRGLPWLVAEMDGVVIGYAYAAPFRAREAYRYTVEDSVYVKRDVWGQGVGRLLLTRLIERCRALGYKQLLALIGDSQNIASIRVHERCGFQHSGVLRDVGIKFDRFLDVVVMQKEL
jgi:phosphinothricin acetyltransferase